MKTQCKHCKYYNKSILFDPDAGSVDISEKCANLIILKKYKTDECNIINSLNNCSYFQNSLLSIIYDNFRDLWKRIRSIF